MEQKETTLSVYHHNDLNTVPMGRLTADELDLFFTICATVKEKGTDEITLTFDKIRQISQFSQTSNTVLANALKSTNKKLLNMDFTIETEHKIVQFVLFTMFEIDKQKQTLKVSVNTPFVYLLNDLTGNFTMYELKEFIRVKGKYSKMLYSLLKQYRKKGYFFIDINEFREFFDVPKSYQMCDIDKKVLEPAINELKPFFKRLKVKKVKDPKQKNKVVKLEFFFQKELGAIAPGTVSKEDKTKAAAIRDEDDIILKSMNEVPVFTED